MNSGNSIPEGPPVWICGDCHVGNIGPLADAKGKVEIQIRDLDQTCIGNPAHDLIRLGLSLAMASRGSNLPGITVVAILEQMVEGYEAALLSPQDAAEADGEDLAPIQSVLRQSRERAWHHLAKERIEDVTPRIPLGEKYWALTPEEEIELKHVFHAEPVRAKITALKGRPSDARIRFVDAAYWMKGCSSLGRLRYAVLLGIGRKREHDYCLVDLKEATAAAAPRSKATPELNYAQRVVTGACHLSPNLGNRMLPLMLSKKPVVMRELMPQDLKFDLDKLTQEQAIAAAHFLAGVVGKAHRRQMDRKTGSAWHAELKQQHSKSLDAPNWLWSSVTALIANHELAYLEHCRRFAATAKLP